MGEVKRDDKWFKYRTLLDYNDSDSTICFIITNIKKDLYKQKRRWWKIKLKELLFGNYEDEAKYIPNLIRRFRNKINRKCSCGLFRYCLYDYIFPNQSELKKINTALPEQKEYKCANCEESKVEHKGNWCDNCNLPDHDIGNGGK